MSGNDAMRGQLLLEMTETDFLATDLALFLNTHPNSVDALEAYNDAVTRSKGIKREYERFFGPITGARCENNDCWQWVENPWPWQKVFNRESSIIFSKTGGADYVGI